MNTTINQKINTPVTPVQQNNRGNVSFSGNSSLDRIPDKLIKPAEFAGNTLNRGTFTALAIVFLLGCRYMQSRNKDEKREVATRDFSAVVTAVYCVPILKKIIGNNLEKHSGFALLDGVKEKGFKIFDRQLAENHQIKEWYSYDKKNQDIVSFAKNLADRGAKLGKVFSKDEASKKALLEILGTSEIPNNNEQVINAIKKAKEQGHPSIGKLEKIYQKETLEDIISSPELFKERLSGVKGKAKKVIEHIFGKDYLNKTDEIANALKNNSDELVIKGKPIIEQGLVKENKALKYAQFLKAIPLSAGIVSTAVFLGWLLPWFNIHYTRALYKAEKNKAENQTPSKPALPVQQEQPKQVQKTAEPVLNVKLSESQSKLFSEFKK